MVNLLIQPIFYPISSSVNLVHSVTRENSVLKYIELKVLDIKKGGVYEEKTKELECCCVILTGKADVIVEEEVFNDLGRRSSVFEKIPTDSVYVGLDQKMIVTAKDSCRILLAYAPTTKKLPNRLISSDNVGIEKRGKYQNQRLVHNILTDGDNTSDKLLVVEVYTEGGNFSSYPPHKHDQDNLPDESLLEETYYHEINPQQGFVFQRIYTDDKILNETMAVENENVVLVPKGYHPVGVPDGYTSYYLNVMAGPTKAWKFYDDPKHAWILKRP